MSLAERLAEMESPKRAPCKYARVIEKLREVDENTDEFHERVMGKRIGCTKASQVLDAEDNFVAETVIRKHVAGTCCCNR